MQLERAPRSPDAVDARPAQPRIYPALKPAVDAALAGALLIAAAPALLLALLLVRLTSAGPALYSQERLGLGGRRFRIYKVRTMRHNCERETGPRWAALAGDPRVTPLGRVLRRTHLDELPQLWNIARGEMSLVGPRPERPELAGPLALALERYGDRLAVRPGLTGLAQVQLPPDVDLGSVRAKLALDLAYVERAGLWLDLRIVAATALKLAGVPFGAIRRLLALPGPAAPAPPRPARHAEPAPAMQPA